MPNYTLRCTSCGEVYSKRISYAKLNEQSCPKCGSQKKERVYAGYGFAIGKNKSGG